MRILPAVTSSPGISAATFPGNPAVTVQDMPGAGGTGAAAIYATPRPILDRAKRFFCALARDPQQRNVERFRGGALVRARLFGKGIRRLS